MTKLLQLTSMIHIYGSNYHIRLKCHLIEYGSIPRKSSKYSATLREDKHEFPPGFFTRTLNM
jgi:hypothetical protein